MLQAQGFGKNFKVTFLNCSSFNRKELGDSYLKAASYGLPTISMYAASQGLGQSEIDNMSFLETAVLGLQEMFQPIISSTQLSHSSTTEADENEQGGRPQLNETELSDSGEQTREDGDDWG